MTRTRTAPRLLLVGLLAVVPVAADPPAVAAGDAPRITVEDLGTLGGGSSEALDVNELGQVVGSSQIATGHLHAFLWEDGQMRDLGTLGGEASGALALNDRGQVVGWAEDADGVPHAVLWEDGEIREIAGPGTAARYVSEDGRVVVDGLFQQGEMLGIRAFVWEEGTLTEIGPVREAYPNLTIADVNRNGWVTGWTAGQGFLWRDGELVVLGGVTRPDGDSFPAGVNDAGQVVARSEVPDATWIWQDGLWTPLTPSGTGFDPTDINENGTVVGGVRDADGDWDAFVVRDGEMVELGADRVGWSTLAERVNDSEQVVGEAWVDGRLLAVLWQDDRTHVLPPLFDGADARALDLSERGQVAGFAYTRPYGEAHAVLWTVSGRS